MEHQPQDGDVAILTIDSRADACPAQHWGTGLSMSVNDRLPDSGSHYSIAHVDEVDDAYASSDVPGEFRSLTNALGAEQLALTLMRIPPRSDLEQGTGHLHEEIEEIYVVTRGRLTMRLGDDVVEVAAGTAVRVAPLLLRSHRNEGDEPVELWAISRTSNDDNGEKVDDFWGPSPKAAQTG
jgi:mannose-6-phosphate isomerase-like protein (cupin superfamily)